MRPVSLGQFGMWKWYLDCVNERGDAAIVYCAEVRWGRVRLHYSSILALYDGSVVNRSSVAKFANPAETELISLTLPNLGVLGSWERATAPVEQTIFECDTGRVQWDCVQPKSSARLHISDLGEFRGLGYAERLTLTVPPWRLPLRELRWGRYLSPEDSLVWVDWQGSFSSRFAFHNGQKFTPPLVSDSEVELDAGALQLDCGSALRSGRLGDTVLPGAPVLRKFFPSLLGTEEKKWRSRGTLTLPSRSSSGWAIHEVVHWNT